MFDLGRSRRGVHTVTDAPRPMSEDIRYRQKRYLIMMGVRVAGLVLAVFLFHGVWRFLAAAVAIVMPYFAVVFANGGREPDNRRFEPYDPGRRQLPAPSPDRASGQASDRNPGQYPSPDQAPSWATGSTEATDRTEATGRTGRTGSEGSLSAEEATADHPNQSRTRSNRA